VWLYVVTAATLLAQLSTEEAAALREAVRNLGPIDPDEQADVYSEFRREKPVATQSANQGVELALSSSAVASDLVSPSFSKLPTTTKQAKRFEFLEDAPAQMLATYLSREQAQTIAGVLSYVAPARAASVLAAMPAKLQAETMERLANLGDTDAEVVSVIERELAAWIEKRRGDMGHRSRRRDAVSSILAAADAKTRSAIVANLKSHGPQLAGQLEPLQRERARQEPKPRIDEYRVVKSMAKRLPMPVETRPQRVEPAAPVVSRPAPPRIDFDHLANADSRTLARLLNVADPNVLALALAGSSDELLERVCDQMPKRIAKAFRRELRQMGPTRLSDMEAAQNAIADLAAKQIAERRASLMDRTAVEPSTVERKAG